MTATRSWAHGRPLHAPKTIRIYSHIPLKNLNFCNEMPGPVPSLHVEVLRQPRSELKLNVHRLQFQPTVQDGTTLQSLQTRKHR